MIVEFISAILMVLGVLFFFGTVVGLLRFPDFYTRVHAAGKGDTLSTFLIVIGVIIYTLYHGHFELDAVIVALKLLGIVAFIFLGSPTATHAIMDAGFETEVKHWTKKHDS